MSNAILDVLRNEAQSQSGEVKALLGECIQCLHELALTTKRAHILKKDWADFVAEGCRVLCDVPRATPAPLSSLLALLRSSQACATEATSIFSFVHRKRQRRQLERCRGQLPQIIGYKSMLTEIEHRITMQHQNQFLWSGHEVMEKRSSSPFVDVYVARRRSTHAIRVIRCFKEGNPLPRKLFNLLKHNVHSSVEYPIQQDANGTILSFVSGEHSFIELVCHLPFRRKIGLWIELAAQAQDIKSGLEFIAWAQSLCSIPGQSTAGPIESWGPDYIYSSRLAWDGRFILPLINENVVPLNSRPLPHPSTTLFNFKPFERLPRDQGFERGIEWIVYCDAYEESFFKTLPASFPWPRYFIMTEDGIPDLSGWIDGLGDTSVEPHTELSYCGKEGILEVPTQLLSYNQRRYTLTAWDDSSEFELVTIRRCGETPWMELARSVPGIAAQYGVQPSRICAVSRIVERMSLHAASPYDLNGAPLDIFFFAYPTVEIGPRHIAPGYLALDMHGHDVPSLSDFTHDLDRGQWTATLTLEHFTVVMDCSVDIFYVSLTEEEICMLEEDEFYSDEISRLE